MNRLIVAALNQGSVRSGCGHLGNGAGHARPVDVLLLGRQHLQLLLLLDLFGQHADLLHLLVLALLVRVILARLLPQLLLLLQVLQFLWEEIY